MKEINPQNGETHSSERKGPLSRHPTNSDGEQLLPPTGDAAAIRPRQPGSCRRSRGPPGHDGEGSARINQVLEIRLTVRHEKEATGANCRNNAPAT